MVVLVCFGTHRPEVMAQIEKLAGEQELYAPDVPVAGEEIFTREYAKAHREELERVYGLLADDHSRKVLRDVVEYKLTGDIKLLRGCESEPREAWESILRPRKEEHYMDLGAYTGAVSYTHLDVYKRQAFSFTALCSRDRYPHSARPSSGSPWEWYPAG